MYRFIARRLLALVPVMLGVTVLVFLVFHYTADPADVILGQHALPEAKAKLNASLGWNDPIYLQYGRFALGLLRGDLGTSWITKAGVAQEIGARFGHTVELAVLAMLITVAVGILIGVLSAVRRYSLLDHASMIVALVGVSMPVFWLGLELINLFSVKLKWTPISGRMDPVLLSNFKPPTAFYLTYTLLTGQWRLARDLAAHIILPAIALSSVTTAIVARMTRATMLEVLRQDYVRTARAKGLAQRVVIFKHALKNALIPVITVIGLQFGTLLGGAVLTETVFTWPGIGSLAITAVQNQDVPLVQGVVILVAAIFVLVNLAVDLAYGWLDPRIRYS